VIPILDGFIGMWQAGFYHFIGSFQMIGLYFKVTPLMLLCPDKIPVTNCSWMVDLEFTT
jgi:hypothetical protein